MTSFFSFSNAKFILLFQKLLHVLQAVQFAVKNLQYFHLRHVSIQFAIS